MIIAAHLGCIQASVAVVLPGEVDLAEGPAADGLEDGEVLDGGRLGHGGGRSAAAAL